MDEVFCVNSTVKYIHTKTYTIQQENIICKYTLLCVHIVSLWAGDQLIKILFLEKKFYDTRDILQKQNKTQQRKAKVKNEIIKMYEHDKEQGKMRFEDFCSRSKL